MDPALLSAPHFSPAVPLTHTLHNSLEAINARAQITYDGTMYAPYGSSPRAVAATCLDGDHDAARSVIGPTRLIQPDGTGLARMISVSVRLMHENHETEYEPGTVLDPRNRHSALPPPVKSCSSLYNP